MFDTTIPLIKYNDMSFETITPRISFRVNPGNNMDDQSTTSRIVDLGNVFELDRLGISEYEAGRSLTLGLGYKFDQLENFQDDDVKDKFIEFNLATVLRDQIESEIPSTSTINLKNSNIFGSIRNNLFDVLFLIGQDEFVVDVSVPPTTESVSVCSVHSHHLTESPLRVKLLYQDTQIVLPVRISAR